MSKTVLAKYIRLSMDDAVTDSLSIENQRRMLDRHIEDLDIPDAEIIEFVDNGYSGTNFERPAVQEMLSLLQSGGISILLSKDFSRLGRSALETGYFVEQVFPLYQVRYISVDDNYDSDDYKNDTGGIDIAFKFLMHEYYSKDLSQKAKSAMRVKMNSGECFCKRRIFGYERTNDKSQAIDEVAAVIVRRIFSLAKNGYTTAQIRDIMASENVPTPSQYLAIKHEINTRQSDVWTARMVLAILKNEQYIGTYVAGKQESKAVGSHSKRNLDRSEWITIPDNHPPIVSKEDFAMVQSILERNRNSIVQKPTKSLLLSDESRILRERMINGERLPNNIIYGYIKGENGEMVVDNAAKPIIQSMFDMAVKGQPLADIVAKLSSSRKPTPDEHIKLGKGKKITPLCRWTVKSARNILKNIQYTGAFVSGRILKNYETGKKFHVPEQDWIVIPGKNPAIVNQELFEQVQKILATRKPHQPRTFLLDGGIIKCGCCGYGLVYDPLVNPVFRCIHTKADPTAECHKMTVNVRELDEAVLAIIEKQAQVVLGRDSLQDVQVAKRQSQRIADYEHRIKECTADGQHLYELYHEGEIDHEAYMALKAQHSEMLTRLKQNLALLVSDEKARQAVQKANSFVSNVMSNSASPKKIVDALVKKVYVYPDNRIEIDWLIEDFTK